jgi:hypothetical protein
MTERTIGVNQSIDARLQCCFTSFDVGLDRPVPLWKIP